MVLKMPADPGRLMNRLYAKRTKMRRVTDPTQLQKLRGADRTGSHQDFAADPRNHILSVAPVGDSPCAPALEANPADMSPGHNREVAAAHRRPQKGNRAGAAHAAPCRRQIGTDANPLTWRFFSLRKLALRADIAKVGSQRMMIGACVRYRQTRRAAAGSLGFDPVERRLDRGIVPTLIAGFGPVVVIA